MTSEEIKKFIESKITLKSKYVKIEFGKRDPIYGLFVTEGGDYKDLSSKNFWRIVPGKNFDAYSKNSDLSLSRIFNGAEFSKLSLLSDEF